MSIARIKQRFTLDLDQDAARELAALNEEASRLTQEAYDKRFNALEQRYSKNVGLRCAAVVEEALRKASAEYKMEVKENIDVKEMQETHSIAHAMLQNFTKSSVPFKQHLSLTLESLKKCNDQNASVSAKLDTIDAKGSTNALVGAVSTEGNDLGTFRDDLKKKLGVLKASFAQLATETKASLSNAKSHALYNHKAVQERIAEIEALINRYSKLTLDATANGDNAIKTATETRKRIETTWAALKAKRAPAPEKKGQENISTNVNALLNGKTNASSSAPKPASAPRTGFTA